MLRKLLLCSITVLVIFNSCLDSYTLDVDGYENLLVVDGLITDENKSHDVILTRSTSDIDEDSPYETGATVYLTDSIGDYYYFTEYSSGVYSSDSTDLIVEVGDKYTLHIQTQDGATYQSDECEIFPKTTIDSVYYKKDSDWDDSGENLYEGLSFYVDGCMDDTSSYVRVLYYEDWEFKTPYPETYIVLEDNTLDIIRPLENWLCYKHNSSDDINVFSMSNQVGSEINEKQVVFVGSSVSDRLTIRYCLGVRLLTISKEEYEYWRKLAEATEDIGDVFAKQPYSVTGNVYNTENEDETVLGYFQVGSVSFKRMYVNYEDLNAMDLPDYDSSCTLHRHPTLYEDLSFYEIYVQYVINGDYYVYDYDFNKAQLLLAKKTCSDCSLTGDLNMPDFWEE